MAVPLGVFLLAWLLRWRRETLGWLPPAGMIVGLLLALLAMPDLSVPESLDLAREQDRFQGLIASSTALIAGEGAWRTVLVAMACIIGVGGLGALVTLSHRWRLTALAGIVLRVQAFTLVAGWLLAKRGW